MYSVSCPQQHQLNTITHVYSSLWLRRLLYDDAQRYRSGGDGSKKKKRLEKWWVGQSSEPISRDDPLSRSSSKERYTSNCKAENRCARSLASITDGNLKDGDRWISLWAMCDIIRHADVQSKLNGNFHQRQSFLFIFLRCLQNVLLVFFILFIDKHTHIYIILSSFLYRVSPLPLAGVCRLKTKVEAMRK